MRRKMKGENKAEHKAEGQGEKEMMFELFVKDNHKYFLMIARWAGITSLC